MGAEPLNVLLVCPAPRGSRSRNRVTAERWATVLRGLGHRARVRGDWRGDRCDLLIALHARKSGPAALRFRRAHPRLPLVVALTGTDVYLDLPRSAVAARALAAADGIVTLQPLAVRELPKSLRAKARTILQSVPSRSAPRRRHRGCVVSVLGHLRPVKDPFRTAEAARILPPGSSIQFVRAGEALTPAMRRKASREMERNPRYRWIGGVPRARARAVLAASDVLVISSLVEGGAHVVGEAAVAGVPVIASRIPGNVGLLGGSYPGYFPPGDTEALARLLLRFERSPAFRARLREAVRAIAPGFDPLRERRAWRDLMEALMRGSKR